MISIEKDIPLPPNFRPGKRKYPLSVMEVGDSFLVTDSTPMARQIAGYANQQYAPKRFVSRTVEGGRRVWRVK